MDHDETARHPPQLRIDQMREIEKKRGHEKRARRRRLTLSLAVLGAAFSVAGLYITLPARLSESVSVYRFELVRPAWGPFLRVAIGAILSGGFLGAVIGRIGSAGAERRHTPLAWLFYGLLFGLLIPFATGVFIPTTGTIIDLIIGAAPWQGLGLRLFYSVFGTPMFAAVYGILGFYIGLISGVLMTVCGWSIDRLNGSDQPQLAVWGPFSLTLAYSAVLLTIVFFGPFQLFKYLVTTWGSR